MKRYAVELVQAAYKGVLVREADAGGLSAYSKNFICNNSLVDLLKELSFSDEHWERSLENRANELVHVIYQGLLGREPEAEALENYATKLAETHDLQPLLAAISGSEEYWKQQLAKQAPQLIQVICSSLLRRDANTSDLETYTKLMTNQNGLGDILTKIIASDEFVNKKETKEAIVFLHVQKTGGTSLQNMLKDRFKTALYSEHADTLHKHKAEALFAYTAFAGHFNHDSLQYIRHSRLLIFTFVREPKKRLISLYYFLRAHLPTAPGWGEGMVLANDLLIEQFFGRPEQTTKSGLWNHMVWVIMGQQRWQEWRVLFIQLNLPESSIEKIISAVIRPAIRKRLREFVFVGLLEDFDQSIAILGRLLKMEPFKEVRADHSLEKLTQHNPHFKKHIEKQAMTAELDALLDKFVKLDNIVYEEAALLYAEKVKLYKEMVVSVR